MIENSERKAKAKAKQGMKKPRRGKQEGPRNYKCNCGKTYMSFSALYTHIKQKHNLEEFPKWYESERNILEKPCTKGRPHKYFEISTSNKADSFQRDENFLIKIYEDAKMIQEIIEITKNCRSLILNMNEDRISKELYYEVLGQLEKDIGEADKNIFLYLRTNAGNNSNIFLGISADYGSSNWKLLMLHNHFRTIFKPDVFRAVVFISLLSSLGKEVDEIMNDSRLAGFSFNADSSKIRYLVEKISKVTQIVFQEMDFIGVL